MRQPRPGFAGGAGLPVPAVTSGLPLITHLAGGGTGWFADQYGTPRLFLCDSAWALPCNAGRWNGGHPTSDFDAYLAARASQGYTAWQGVAWGNLHIGGVYDDGRTWDGIYPLLVNGTPGDIVTGSETITLNGPFWSRFDYFVAKAATYGITIFLNLGMGGYDFFSGQIWFALSNTQAQAFGQAIATRYLSSPNLIWMCGDDDTGGHDDSIFASMLTGIRAAGDTRPISKEYNTEQTSRADMYVDALLPSTFGQTSAGYEWTYTYNVTYFGVEFAYGEAASFSIPAIPVLWADGFYYGESGGAGVLTDDNVMRRMSWWALASGARGIINASNNVFEWGSGALTAVQSGDNWLVNYTRNVAALYQSLPGWYNLIPDTSSVLVTAGRGTRATSLVSGASGTGAGGVNYGASDNYVAASRTPGGTLAVIYCGQAFSITIDQTKMAAGYKAYWTDPASGVMTLTTSGSTYSSSGLGNNSFGEPDWLLILKA